MTPSARFLALTLAGLLLGPATSWSADPPAGLPPLLPASSIAAVLARRSALELTPDQVKQLEQIQAELDRQQRSAREEAAAPPDAAGPAGAPPAKPSAGPPGGMGGAKARPPPNVRSSGPDPAQLLEQRLDALDTEAFLKAAELLPESQREKAVDVASRYREQLFEQRERERKR